MEIKSEKPTDFDLDIDYDSHYPEDGYPYDDEPLDDEDEPINPAFRWECPCGATCTIPWIDLDPLDFYAS